MEEKNIDLHKTFLEFDEDSNQQITYDEFCEALEGGNFNLRELLAKRDMMTLFRHFDTSNDGQITYLEVRCSVSRSGDLQSSDTSLTRSVAKSPSISIWAASACLTKLHL